MITINGIEFDFDATSPSDMRRIYVAEKKLPEKISGLPEAPVVQSLEDLPAAADYMDAVLKIFGDYIDDLLGDGVAEKLLTANPSLTKFYRINDALLAALGDQGSQLTAMVEATKAKYPPNRATRRARK